MEQGAYITDPCGKRRLLFLDLVGVLGDTPGLNKMLDVRGHQGSAFCHKCRYSTADIDLPRNRSSGPEGGSWRRAWARNSDRHLSVRLMNVGDDLLKQIGLSEGVVAPRNFLKRVEETMRATKGRTRKVTNGRPVVPSCFDGFAAANVAPDHLLSGHYSDIMNCALNTLEKEKRDVFLDLIRAKADECGVILPNRLDSSDEIQMATMKTSEMFAIIPLAHICYDQVIRMDNRSVIQDFQIKILNTLRSAKEMAAVLWTDGAVYEKLALHMEQIRATCEISDSMIGRVRLTDGTTKAEKKMSYQDKIVHRCVRFLDKPNTHRLVEYMAQHQEMWQSMVPVTELSLEKCHQRAKQALRRTNGKEEHFFVMRNIRFNDWQGRLFGCLVRNEAGVIAVNLRSAVATLGGRELLEETQDNIFNTWNGKLNSLRWNAPTTLKTGEGVTAINIRKLPRITMSSLF